MMTLSRSEPVPYKISAISWTNRGELCLTAVSHASKAIVNYNFFHRKYNSRNNKSYVIANFIRYVLHE